MKLQEAFNISIGDVVSIIGAGGKTSLLVGLGYELAEQGWRVLATTTVDFDKEQLQLVPHALPVSTPPHDISEALNTHRFVLLYQQGIDGDEGLTSSDIAKLLDSIDSDVLLVEADQANRKPLKSPYQYEPVIPAGTSLVIPVISLDALGKPLNEDHIYNAKAIIERYGFPENAEIRTPWLAQVLRDETLGLYGVPELTRVVGFINQTPESGYGRWRARIIAQLALKSKRFSGVALGHVRGANPVHEVQRSVAAVVLAAGLSSRMDQHKILMPWSDNLTIIESIIYRLIKARIDEIIVVTGYNSKAVKQLLEPYDVKLVFNRAYKTGGILSSIQEGLRAVPPYVSAALMCLGDQPQLQSKVIYQLGSTYAQGDDDLVIPTFSGQNGYPVMIGRRYWDEIISMRRGRSLEEIFEIHSDCVKSVPVSNDSILRGIDTIQEYENERLRHGL